jgi:DNA-directed RNA polymerase subunit RPC12/RpoP
MTSEFDLDCATCGTSLTRCEVTGDALGVGVSEPLEVAECPDCGGRYFPETTLKRLEN